jgi:hypothetical protein
VDDIKKEFVVIGKMVFARLEFLRGVDLNLYIEQPVLADKFRSAIDVGFKQMVDVAREFNCYLLPELTRYQDATAFLNEHWMLERILTKRKEIDEKKSYIRTSFKSRQKIMAEVDALEVRKKKADNYHLPMGTLAQDIADKKIEAKKLLNELDAAYEDRKKLVEELEDMKLSHVQQKIAMKLFLNYIAAFYIERHQLNIIMNGDNARASRGGVVGSELYVNPKNMNTINMQASYDALQSFYIAFGESVSAAAIQPKPLLNPSCFKRIKVN